MRCFQRPDGHRRLFGDLSVVFGAFGCGAFRNPADRIAHIYRDEIKKRTSHFRVIAFAIFHAGYGPNNFSPFQEALSDFGG